MDRLGNVPASVNQPFTSWPGGAGDATWAMTHDSLLIVTWDEDDGSAASQIPTIFAGQRVKPGRYPMTITHYGVLRTIEDALGLPHDGAAASVPPVTGIWPTG